MFDQPDDVAGQLRYLLGRECNTGTQMELAGKGGAIIHQCLILQLIVTVTVQKAPASQLDDLFAQDTLFVEGVAETFLRQSWIKTECFEQVVAAQPLLAIGEARVGFDQGAGIGHAVDLIEVRLREFNGSVAGTDDGSGYVVVCGGRCVAAMAISGCRNLPRTAAITSHSATNWNGHRIVNEGAVTATDATGISDAGVDDGCIAIDECGTRACGSIALGSCCAQTDDGRHSDIEIAATDAPDFSITI